MASHCKRLNDRWCCSFYCLIVAVVSFAGPPRPIYSADDDRSNNSPLVILTINEGSGFITFSPDGKHLAGKVSGKSWRATDIRIWEVATGKQLTTLVGHTGGIWQMSYSPDGKRLASNDNWTVKIWNLKQKKEIRSFNTPAFTRSILFNGDGTQILTGHDDGRIRIWDVETARLVRTLKGHTDWVPSLALSPDGKRLASGSIDLTARLWDLETGKQVLLLRGSFSFARTASLA